MRVTGKVSRPEPKVEEALQDCMQMNLGLELFQAADKVEGYFETDFEVLSQVGQRFGDLAGSLQMGVDVKGRLLALGAVVFRALFERTSDTLRKDASEAPLAMPVYGLTEDDAKEIARIMEELPENNFQREQVLEILDMARGHVVGGILVD